MSSEEIRAAMRRKGIRQSDLAQRLGVSHAAISNVLHERCTQGGKLEHSILSELGLIPVQALEKTPRCPFMSSFPVRLAMSVRSTVKRLIEALAIAVIANILTK